VNLRQHNHFAMIDTHDEHDPVEQPTWSTHSSECRAFLLKVAAVLAFVALLGAMLAARFMM
jgi:hypothetical protein